MDLKVKKFLVKCLLFIQLGLYKNEFVPLECTKVCDLLSIGGTVLGTTNCGHFASTPLEEEVTQISKKHFDANGLDCLVRLHFVITIFIFFSCFVI